MSFRYFAYGSNLWVPHMRSRCPSATPLETVSLPGWTIVCDKPSTDGSAKLNIRPDPGGVAPGLVYEIADGDRASLDAAEPRYVAVTVDIADIPTLTYTYRGDPHHAPPYDWYAAVARAGSAQHGLPEVTFTTPPVADPLAGSIRPATAEDLGLVQSILSEGLVAGDGRYYIHPGDYAWWVYHDDPRHPDHFSTWVQADRGFMTIDSRAPNEINVFTRPGIDRMPLVRWAQRRLGDRGEVGWIDDGDSEMITALCDTGYSPGAVIRRYQWDLAGDIPRPELPEGWQLRPVAGEEEANRRRAASHAAFESTMPEAIHLQRYLSFMRSPVYLSERDLVAVTPNGRVASFMIWWGDDSGVAQVEPFGTHPDFHRRGVGRALLYYGLSRMKEAGMRQTRVCTDEDREATAFYEGVGFRDVGRLRWWRKSSPSAAG